MKPLTLFSVVLSSVIISILAGIANAQVVHGSSRDNTPIPEHSLATPDSEYASSMNQADFASVALVSELTELASFDNSTECGCCDSACCGYRDFCTRKTLTNGFWGAVPKLATHGIMYKASITQFYQGVTSGGNEQRFRYGDKIDQYFIFDSEKLGLWKGGKLIMHGESQLGQSSIADAPALAPVNTAMLFPVPGEAVTSITTFQFEQELGHGYAATFGKFNFADLWQTLYPDFGSGLDGFMNVSQIAPLNVIPTLPTVFNGAGLLKVGERGIEGGVMAIDSKETPTVIAPDLFDNGVTIFGFARKFTDFGGLPGSHLIGATYATGEFTSLDRAGWHIFPDEGVVAPRKEGSWLAAYVMDQKLWVDPCNEKRSIGLWGMTGFADPEASPYAATMNASIQAFGLNRGRPGDRMGIGYFYQWLSDDFKNLPGRLLPLQNMQGGEAYYNAEITPWFHLTADLQVVQPAEQNNDTAVVLGLRGKLDL